MDIYNAFIPAWINSLRCLKNIISKAEMHANEQGYASEILLNSRLFPDMFHLIKQVQIVCDLLVRAGARLTMAELPSYSDDEVTFDDLQVRIDSTIAYLSALNEDPFAGAEQREVDIPAGGGRTQTMTGQQYILGFVIPNVYFHMTTAYNLLRHNGVVIGKRDFLLAGE